MDSSEAAARTPTSDYTPTLLLAVFVSCIPRIWDEKQWVMIGMLIITLILIGNVIKYP